MNQQSTQISVASFTDSKKDVSFTARMLTRHQSKPRGKVPTIVEIMCITDRSYQSSSRHRPNTINSSQALAYITAAEDAINAFIVRGYLLVNVEQTMILIGNNFASQRCQLD